MQQCNNLVQEIIKDACHLVARFVIHSQEEHFFFLNKISTISEETIFRFFNLRNDFWQEFSNFSRKCYMYRRGTEELNEAK